MRKLGLQISSYRSAFVARHIRGTEEPASDLPEEEVGELPGAGAGPPHRLVAPLGRAELEGNAGGAGGAGPCPAARPDGGAAAQVARGPAQHGHVQGHLPPLVGA